MTKFSRVSSSLASIASGVCVALALLSAGVASADAVPPPDNEYIICQYNCSQPNCGGIFCQCAVPGNTCKYSLVNNTDCDCRTGT